MMGALARISYLWLYVPLMNPLLEPLTLLLFSQKSFSHPDASHNTLYPAHAYDTSGTTAFDCTNDDLKHIKKLETVSINNHMSLKITTT
jgi:hypothetical protein